MKSKKALIVWNIGYLLVLVAVILPLLLVGNYNVPSGDDWSYGYLGYQYLTEGKGVLSPLVAAFQMMKRTYITWEGRFMNSLLAALQPGIWGEHFYKIVVWIMLGGLIGFQLLSAWIFLAKNRKENRFLWIPVIVPSLMIQILYTPSVVESFYWYAGAVNYTWISMLGVLFLTLFIKRMNSGHKGTKAVLEGCFMAVLALMIGGDNFATSLSAIVAMISAWIMIYVCEGKEKFIVGIKKTWFLFGFVLLSLGTCVFSPAITSRMNANFGGENAYGPVQAVVESLYRTFWNIISWTDMKMILLILLIIPFAYRCVGHLSFPFKKPVLYTFLSFCVYASEITATLYVDGTTGGGRMAAILYYAYHIWLLSNLFYWIGWFVKKERQTQRKFPKWSMLKQVVHKHLFFYCIVVGIVLMGTIYRSDLKGLSSYRAYRDLRQGWAKTYYAEWQERYRVLHDPEVMDVVFEPLSVYPETILYTDLQDEKGYVWVNKACATYYGKNSIKLTGEDISD